MKKIVLILAAVLLILLIAQALADTHTHNYVWKSTLDKHWKECTICGDRINEEAHYGFACDQGESHCYACGAKESEGAIIEMYGHQFPWKGPFEISVATHSFTCTVCGETVTEQHGAYCYNVGVCYVCDASEAKDGIVINQTYHNYIIKSTLYKHWEECTYCGKKINEYDHEGYACDQGEPHCYYCGAKASEGAIISMFEHGHPSDITDYSISIIKHSWTCPICKQTVSEGHAAVCSEASVCIYCGASEAVDGIKISRLYHLNNNLDDYTVYDATYHQFPCTECGEIFLEVHEYIGDSTICRICGYDKGAPQPTAAPTATPTTSPTAVPTDTPTATPTAAPTAAPSGDRYTAQATFDAQQKFLHGTVTLKEGAEELTRIFARITYFFADGTYTTGSVSVVDGEFEGMTSGDVIHIGIQIVDTYKVRPGEYNRFGATEFDVN